ncbi:zinc-ribbon domain-containing protein, partial [Anaeromyxobacter oryzisoli]|uniref:zinc-ribbon domain-containing protein n=1 Tax=Anaeromyxobacter oryzisoli TaxID=2925408 RepID=UPI001F5A00FA
MNFSCDQCGRRYSIADEKVAGRRFRLKCRTCEHVITGHGPGAAPAVAAPPVLAPPPAPPPVAPRASPIARTSRPAGS